MTTRYLKYYLAVLVSLLTFAVYLAALQNYFVGWDDGTYVVSNSFIRSFNGTFLKWAFFDFYAANWHPLTWISHALDYAVWGLNPLGHHLTNNILHAVNTFLVVLLIVKLIELASPEVRVPSHHSPFTIHHSRFVLIAAVTTGLLFGLHPLHVESVAWVAERKDLLCALFYLLSLLMYIKGRLVAMGNRQSAKDEITTKVRIAYRLSPIACFSLAFGFFILALMSKPMAVSLPVVLLILDWYPLGRITSATTFRTSCIGKLPFIALSIVSSVLTILAQQAVGAIQAIEIIPFSARVLVAAKSLISYLWKMAVPVNLLPYYPYPDPAGVSLFSLEYLSAVALVMGITAVCLIMAKKQKLWLAVWGYYVATLIPVLGLVQVGGQAMADRYTYLPSLAPFLVAGMIFAGIHEKVKTAGKGATLFKMGSIVAASILLLWMSYATFLQIGLWKDGITLWNYVIEKEPLKVPRAYINAGFALMDKGRMDEAVEYLQIAVELAPENANAHHNLGVAYNSKGMYDRAIEQFQAALRIKPNDPETHNNLGVAFKYQGRYDKAIEEHRIALGLRPEYAEAHFNLGIIYLDRGEIDEARKELEAGLQINPDDKKARQVLTEITSR